MFSLKLLHERALPRQPTGKTHVSYLWIGLGSALGGMARHGCSDLAARYFGTAFPWGTLFVNVTGSLLIGFLASLTVDDGRLLLAPDARAFLMVGLCGGFTTFSALSLETLNLARDGQWIAASGNVVLTVVICLLAVGMGYAAGTAFSR